MENRFIYLEPEIFSDRYPLDKDPLSEGTFGVIYASGNDHIVKKFKKDEEFRSLICEINGYSSNRHPCIMRPIAWTILDNIGFIVMPKGKDIGQAYRDGDISIEEIISDSLSAIADMNSRGYFHGDIKNANMVYHEGLCKIIDMGLVRLCIYGEDGNFYVNEEAYSLMYRTLDYYDEQYNNINSEVYALAVSHLDIIRGDSLEFCSLDDYKSDKPHLEWLFQKARLDSTLRPNAKTLLEEAPKELIVRKHSSKLHYRSETVEIDYIRSFKNYINYLLRLCSSIKITARNTFLVVDLAHRSYELVIESEDEINKKIYSMVLISLACCTSFTYTKSLDFWGRCFDVKDIESKYQDMLINVLIALDGKITNFTYWDYAKSPEDFPYLLQDMTEIDYNPCFIRHSESKINHDKNITIKDIVLKQSYRDFTPIARLEPCKLNNKPDHNEIEKMWLNYNNANTNIASMLNCLYKNRSSLSKVSKKVALEICHYLNKYEYKVIMIPYTLEKIMGPSWKEIIFFCHSKKHPFRNLK